MLKTTTRLTYVFCWLW